MKKYIIIAIFFCAFLDNRAQSNSVLWSKKFDAYQAIWPKTKIQLVFNQDKFTPGDTAYFKAYFLKENLIGVSGKQLIHVNLVDSKGEIKLHFIFSVNNGLGQNQLVIPNTLSEGIYLVTAYSSWMKNFNPALIFKKEIAIVTKNRLEPNEKLTTRVVAEGGHLIKGLSNKISIHHHANSIIQIIDGAGQEIGRTTTDSNGMSSIIFTPHQNEVYFAKVIGESSQISLPLIEDDGCNMRLNCTEEKEPIKLMFTMPPESNLRKEDLTVVVSGKDKVYQTTSFLLGNKEYDSMEILRDNLPEGVIHVSILNQAGKLLASRDFYASGTDAVQAYIEPEKNLFHTREKMKLEVSLKDKNGRPIAGEFSINVLNAELFDTEKQNSFSDQLNILSDVNEDFFINRADTNWITSLDNFLILTTEEIPWALILSKEIQKPVYPFSNAIEKSGVAYLADNQEPVPDFTQIMFYLQQNKERYQTLTHENGKVRLALFDVFGEDEFFYLVQVNGEEIPAIQIKWEDQSIALPHSPEWRITGNIDPYASFITKKRLIDQSYHFYRSPTEMRIEDDNTSGVINFEYEVAEADITKNIQDYIVFPSMQQLLKEVVPSIFHRVVRGKSMVRVQLLTPMIAINDPLYIIDGIVTKNTDFFLSLNPSDLLTIKIVNNPKKLQPLGLLGKNGIVIVQTRNGDKREPLDDTGKLIEGLNAAIEFKAIDYSIDNNVRKPTFRSTLYWNPSIKTDANGKAVIEFYCSDDVGTLRINVKGIAEGKPFSAEHSINVVMELPQK